MRSQARWDHRTPDPVDPPDDWVNGSWTVDCVCGVNFDDGEEMVNCDECGVWVHTRCSRYVKSEKLFACDKCKSRKNKKYSENDRIEEEETETEVAQLLVDLPARTLRRNLGNTSSTHGFQRRIWTPKEERVHVQGVPGGDVGIFCGSGLSSVFGAELWKSTGYVPKKFNFQYKEFDCWNEGNDNLANNGVVNEDGLSLLKDKAGLPADSVSQGAGTKIAREECEKKKGEGENCGVRSTQQSGVKQKDRSLVHYRKSKKEDSQSSKAVTGKKKATVVHAEGNESKKRSPRASRSASTPSSDPKNPASHEGRGVKVDDNVVQSGQHDKIKGNVPVEPSSKGFSSEGVKVDDFKKTLAFSGQTPETSCVVSQKLSLKARPNDECDGLPTFQNTSRTGDGPQLLVNHNGSRRLLERTEDVVALDNINDYRECARRGDRIKTKKAVERLETILPRKDSQNDHDSNGKKSLSRCKQEKAQVNINGPGGFHVQLPPCDGKLDSAGSAPLTQQHDLHVDAIKKAASLDDVQSVDKDVNDLDINTVAAACQSENAGPLSNPINLQINEQLVGSDNSRLLRGCSLEIKQEGQSEELSESRETNLINSGQLTKRKTIISLGKSSSTTATTLLSEAPASDGHKSLDQQIVVSEQKTSSKKDSSASGYVKDRERDEKPKKSAKELPKSFTSSVKTSIRSKIPGTSNTTKTPDESKESTSFPSAKLELVQNISSNLMSGESANSFQSESAASHVDNTATTLGPTQRSEMVNHSSCQPSSKLNHTPQIHPSAAPNTSATLSDEELALLLHHELNSSPRVPRVPRMRHAGSLPQLASPTGANMLMKRSSSSTMGKDHGLVFKRKGKGMAKDGTQNSLELQEESRNVKKSPLLPVQRTNDLACTADSVTRRDVDYGSAAGVQSVNKSMPRATSLNASNASLASSDTSERNLSSTLKSPHNASDDDTGTDVRPIHRTLPGLLSEIMTKRMTYEELCNAVLPHWPHLRKHNGERYAYSSHSQAVLDCLRNRSEWARLVDRGPKTNAGRKRRRSDAEPPKSESDDNGSKKKNTRNVDHKSVVESSQDQFPKGKRNVRKRHRRLALQGRGPVVKRGRRQKEADDVSYDEDCSPPSSSSAKESAESLFSDDETIQGGTSSAVGQSEGSASE